MLQISGPWLITGDFNLVRSVEDKNNGIVSSHLMSIFNAALHSLGVDELPLSGCKFTWTNGQPNPIMSRIDRAFVNNALSLAFPSTSLTPLPRPTSDHTLIISSLSTTIPKSPIFRVENSWLQNKKFLPFLLDSWRCGDHVVDAAGRLAGCLKAARAVAKVWARRIRAPPFLIQNCKFFIMLFDFFEEDRQLSDDERHVRELCRCSLATALKAKAACWKQHGKHKAVREGDANIAFHHAQATGRLRRNCIRHIEINGTLVANHNAKVEALTAFYRNLLGSPRNSSWNFEINQLYSEAGQPGDGLMAPFTEAEAKSVVWGMDRNSAPGPDGFGPSFYKSAWLTVKSQVMQLLEKFHCGQLDLARINRSYMVLIPKKQDAAIVDAFRPICLQNCSVKIIAKILTMRLQREIPRLIDGHQTGFLQGRSIAESFIHAVELTQLCHKRKKESIVVKLDFAKAFDTVNWDALLQILHARGF
jgi:hypothetical protein